VPPGVGHPALSFWAVRPYGVRRTPLRPGRTTHRGAKDPDRRPTSVV
ncbi:MAG: hypothetical protein AVDCRST_MAG77-643, partial [uncultured Chloroflexi bacterium]